MKSIMKFVLRLTLLPFIALVTGLSAAQAATHTDNAVILVYHHVSESTPSSTSISPKQFKAHLELLKKEFNVAPLQDVIDALKAGKPLKDKTVVLTFDDGYENIYTNAHPMLQEFGFPYTVFINPKVIGKRNDQLSWQQVKAMQEDGVLFGNHTQDHPHMLDRNKGESDKAWLNRVWKNVSDAQAQLEDELGDVPRYFAYPFGEYNEALEARVEDEGYTGFAQFSGPVSSQSDFQTLPRFPAAGSYASLKSLKTKLNSLAMPVIKKSLSNPELPSATLEKSVWFEVKGDDVQLPQTNCFFQGEPLDADIDENRVTFSIKQALPIGRSRVNCTAPSASTPGRFYWFSQPFFVAREDGTYPN